MYWRVLTFLVARSGIHRWWKTHTMTMYDRHIFCRAVQRCRSCVTSDVHACYVSLQKWCYGSLETWNAPLIRRDFSEKD